MAFKIVYASEVYDDLQEGADFYNSRKKGLGIRFVKAVKTQIAGIKLNPYSFQLRFPDIRCAPLNLFPYTIHYKVINEKNTIMIVGVFCDYRDPKISHEQVGKRSSG